MSVGSTAHLLGDSLVKDRLVGDLELGADVAAVRLAVAAAARVVEVEFGFVDNFLAVTAPVGLSTTVLLGLVGNLDVASMLAKVAGEGVTSSEEVLGRPMRRIIGLVRAGHDWKRLVGVVGGGLCEV